MFTGIIEATAEIFQKIDSGLTVSRPKQFDDIKIGSSIAVSGVCLSVIAFDTTSISFDVVLMTFSKTKLGSLQIGDSVNLERAMRADARFEGHIVTGHVEGVGRVVAALSPFPSPATGEGCAEEGIPHVWKGVSELRYAPNSVVANARSMRKNPTVAEDLLWKKLRRRSIEGAYFRRQRPIGSHIVDFYCEQLKLAIEVDGGIHEIEEQQIYDGLREEHLLCRGVRMLRFTNDQVIHHMDDVIACIKRAILAPLPRGGGGVGGGGSDSKAPLTRQIEDERSEAEIPGEGLGVGAVKSDCDNISSDQHVQCNTLQSPKISISGLQNSELSSSATLAPLPRGGGGVGGGGSTGNASVLLRISLPPALVSSVVPHGSITLDGVSLTVAEVTEDIVTVALIPLTLAETTLGSLQAGDSVNIETDILAKYVRS